MPLGLKLRIEGMKFVVKRSKWVVNEDGSLFGDSRLLNEEDKMCCLGFCCRQLGATEDEIKGMNLPHRLKDAGERFPMFAVARRRKVHLASSLAQKASRINDDRSIDRKEKERLLIDLFAKHGHEIVFED